MPNPIPKTTPLPTPPSKPSKFHLDVKTGVGFNQYGKGGLDKSLNKMVRQGASTFSNVSGSDKKFLEDLIAEHAKHLPSGSSFSYSTKQDIKGKIEHARQSGTISSTDSSEFKKIVDSL